MRRLQFCLAGLSSAAQGAKLALVLLLMVCVGSVLPMWAQSTSTGTIVGNVTDPTGAVVADATITLTDVSTKLSRTAVSNGSGRYIFVDVTPGNYELTFAKQGFSTSKTQVTVEIGLQTNVNMNLQVGGSSTVVEVTAVGNELQTMNATVGNTINSVAIDSLPSLGRDISSFVELQPGVSPDGSVAGAVVDQSYFSLDGGNNSSDMDGSSNVYFNSLAGDVTGGVATQNNLGAGVGGPTGVMPTPQDSVEEFKINTAGQTADFNSSAGAEVKVVTKRGTNTWHGTAYEYYKDNNWSSNSWQNNFTDTPIPSFHYSRYGGAIGGPIIPKEIFGGKTYFFFNYEGFKFPNSETIARNLPSPALRLGLIGDDVAAGTYYNLNPYSVVYNGTTYPGTGTTWDPRGIGINPLVQQLWNKYEPVPTATAACEQNLCDGVNVQGFSANLNVPTTSKFAVTRLDHDFGSKWHFTSTYRWFTINTANDSQVDIGGFFSGDTLGTPSSQSKVPQRDFFWVGALTTNVTTNTTNDIHYSFLRNYWAYARTGDTPQTSTLGGALEFFSGQNHTQDLGPYNVNTQQTRNRFWDGHDQMIRDDVSSLKGNHLFQFGATYQHNWDYHQRTDNGGGINYQAVYELGDGTTGSLLSSDIPLCSASGVSVTNCGSLTAAVLGIVSLSQIAYTRSGPNLTLNPPLTPASDKSTIPFYNFYFSDTWHMKPTFSLTYGLGYTLEMPPTEAQGKQVEMVDALDQPISEETYIASRKRAALLGQNYNPEIGFALVGNTANGLKYPYNPFYGEFSPRIAAAWSPHFDADSFAGKVFGHEDTVIRAGYGRVFGRLNGVDLVLVPLLGTGLIQPASCFNNLMNGTCGGTGSATAANAFRIGVDGLTAPIPTPSATLAQPFYPGYNGNIPSTTAESLDPGFRPNQVDSVDLTIQRQLSRRITLELGYIGRRITHEYQPVNINAVPYMTVAGGQQFAQAYKNVVLQYCNGGSTFTPGQGLAGGGCNATASAVSPQPFFEAALGGPTSTYCAPFAASNPTGPCTAAVVANEATNIALAQVWSMWSDLDAAGFTFAQNSAGVQGSNMMNNPNYAAGATGPQMNSGPAINSSIGYGNYNGGFFSLKMADWRGLTLQSNFTYSKALGTGAVFQADSEYTPDDPFNLRTMYGYQSYNRKYVYNMFFVYQPPFFKGQQGLAGRVLGGWTLSTIFSAGSGEPIEVYTSTGDGQEFGAGDNANYFGNENALAVAPVKSGHVYYQPGGGFPNIFKIGGNAINYFRNPILGLDTNDGGFGNLIGLPYWNLDASVKKSVRVAENVTVEFQAVVANILNHNQWLDPAGAAGFGLFSGSGGWGVLAGGSAQEQPGGDRQVELGLRVRF